MKKQARNVALLLLMASLITGTLGYGQETRNTDDCMGPLESGTFSTGVKVGGAPTFWFGKDQFFKDTTLSTGHTVIAKLENDTIKEITPSFTSLFSTPFWAAAEIGYAVSDSVQLYAEFVARHARGKNIEFDGKKLTGLNDIESVTLSMDNTNSFGAYAGFRHYVGPWYDCIYPFWGLKVGFLHHRDITGTIDIKTDKTTKSDNAIFYESNNVVSGGLAVGFDSYITDCLKFQFSVEVLASGSRNGNATFNTKAGDYVIKSNIGNTGFELAVPVTFGLVFEF